MRDDWDRERESLVSELNEKLMKLALPMKTIESVRVERGPSQPVAAQMFHARRERQRSRLDRRRFWCRTLLHDERLLFTSPFYLHAPPSPDTLPTRANDSVSSGLISVVHFLGVSRLVDQFLSRIFR